jgi:SET domain-containing protein 6
MRSTKSIRKGEELFNDCGPLPRSDLLRRYGYITDNYAQFDVVEIASQNAVGIAGEHLEPGETEARVSYFHLAIGELSHSLTLEKIQILDGESLYDPAYDLSHPTPSSSAFPDELLILINLLLLPQIPGKLPRPEKTPQTIAVLRRILEARLREYPTKLEEDEALLQGGELSPRRRMAVEVRLGEKRVLKEAWFEIAGDDVDGEENEQLMDVDSLGWGVKREAEDLETGESTGEWREKRRKKDSEEL